MALKQVISELGLWQKYIWHLKLKKNEFTCENSIYK
jgi:hypothetical protein